MASPCMFYPLRGVIRCLAKSYLTVASDTGVYLAWDKELFTGLSATLLNPTLEPLLASAYQSRGEAALVEEQLAMALADTYQRVVRHRHREQVQQLNALL
ncbi:MAG: hypothetical protein AAFY17_08345 [Cyanobacteria bacterium J06642_11]